MKNRFKSCSLKNTFLFWLLCFVCSSSMSQIKILPGAFNQDLYIPILNGKKIGVVAHQASLIPKNNGTQHLIDFLIEKKINIHCIFAPEHGFRGTADAGEKINDNKDPITGLQIISLYGKNKKPTKEQLNGIEILIFDLQDVGVRFFTYLSTLHYVMEACAENNIPLIVLDRPNPNVHYVDGPVMEEEQTSFLGLHPVPIVYGMTIGEYAQMINGQAWLKNGLTCDLTVIKMINYDRQTKYDLPINPSPNLPNSISVILYPSLCFFEGTNVRVGRGTNIPFQHFGAPYLKSNYSFTPSSGPGSKYPKHENVRCFGKDLRNENSLSQINLEYLLFAYQNCDDKESFFNTFFDKLAGGKKLKNQIISGMLSSEIRQSWQKDLQEFKQMREFYLLYD